MFLLLDHYVVMWYIHHLYQMKLRNKVDLSCRAKHEQREINEAEYYCHADLHGRSMSLCVHTGCDNVVILWNVARGESVVRIDSVHPDLIYSACWNSDGSKILTTCKDKTMRVLDPRKGTVLVVGFRLFSVTTHWCQHHCRSTKQVFLINKWIIWSIKVRK